NLSVEDVELGKILNQINLGCDKSEYSDIVSYYDSMGPALLRLCKYEQAISYYDETLNETPKNIEALNNKGSALTKMGHYEEAINFYDMVIDIDSKNFQALNNKANALTNLENYGTSITLYEKALLLDPNNPIIQKNLKLTIEKLSSLPPPPEEIQKPSSIVEKTEKKSVVLDTNKPELNLFDQISNALSSFFGFLS
ncbi:MAG: tetratricopeptide repeat protein, partial [Nitrosopumilaceae archaeon]